MSNINSTVCRADIPYPSVSNESVPSLIANLVQALYGEINKSVVDGRVVWDIPCDPNNTASVPQLPREDGEGLMCYLIRLASSGIYTPVYPGVNILTYNVPGTYTWTPPLFVPRAKITLVGAGGGGGGGSASGAGTLATAGGDTVCAVNGWTFTAQGGRRGSLATNRYTPGNAGYDSTAGDGGNAYSTKPGSSAGSGGYSPTSAAVYAGQKGTGLGGYYGGGGAARGTGGGAGLFGGGGAQHCLNNGDGGRGFMYGGSGSDYTTSNTPAQYQNAGIGGGGGAYSQLWLGGGGGAYVLFTESLPLVPVPITFTVGAAGSNGTNGSGLAGDGLVVIEF